MPSTTLRSRSATSASARPRRESPFEEARLPGNEWALYPYIGLSSAVHTEFRAKIPQGENFCVTVIMAEPGRGAPLHAHTTEEIIALTGRWGIFWEG